MNDLNLKQYALPAYKHALFAPGGVILDIAFGSGTQLRQLSLEGCYPVGIEIKTRFVKEITRENIPALLARAEHLPFRAHSFDGAICKVVLPYVDEQQALIEIARVLRPGTEVDLTVHGIGYYMLYLLRSPRFKTRLYGARTILNTWFFCLTRTRLPGFLGDTRYQSLNRLQRYFDRNGLRVVTCTPSRRFLGLPVFLYLRVRKN